MHSFVQVLKEKLHKLSFKSTLKQSSWDSSAKSPGDEVDDVLEPSGHRLLKTRVGRSRTHSRGRPKAFGVVASTFESPTAPAVGPAPCILPES